MRSRSESFAVGATVNGSRMKPFLKRLTAAISAHCSSIVLLQWTIPIPPKSAMWIAICASVTVSIGDEMNGVLSSIFRVIRDLSETSFASNEMWLGRMMKSLYV